MIKRIKLDLGPTIKIHNEFHIKQLKPYFEPTEYFPYRKCPSMPGPVAPNNHHEVEKIVDERIRYGKPEYLIKYKDYPETHNEWKKPKDLNCDNLLRKFLSSRGGVGRDELKEPLVEVRRSRRLNS